jgi:type I restriction enzyme S subunit
VAAACTAVVQPLVQRMVAAIHESRVLAAARDAPLPKLLSGELRVRDAEKTVELVAQR